MHPRESSGDSVLLSIVTVVRNDPAGFAQTLDSLSKQSNTKFQWVIVDSSTNKNEIPSLLEDSDLTATYQWVQPEGIYPAMNIGAADSVGDYLYFLNAGDTLTDSQTLNRVELALSDASPVWAYGGVYFWNQRGEQLHEPPWNYKEEYHHRFSRGRFPPHQSVFVKKDAFTNLGGFDTSYAIAADFNMICQLSNIQKPLVLEHVIANFTQGGASTVSWKSAHKEFRQIRKSAFPPTPIQRIEEAYFGIKAYASHLVANGLFSSRE